MEGGFEVVGCILEAISMVFTQVAQVFGALNGCSIHYMYRWHVQIYAKDAHSMDMIRYEQIKILGTLEMHRVAL